MFCELVLSRAPVSAADLFWALCAANAHISTARRAETLVALTHYVLCCQIKAQHQPLAHALESTGAKPTRTTAAQHCQHDRPELPFGHLFVKATLRSHCHAEGHRHAQASSANTHEEAAEEAVVASRNACANPWAVVVVALEATFADAAMARPWRLPQRARVAPPELEAQSLGVRDRLHKAPRPSLQWRRCSGAVRATLELGRSSAADDKPRVTYIRQQEEHHPSTCQHQLCRLQCCG